MANAYGYDKPKTKQTFEMFHLIGDPEMEMWTDVPAELMVEFPDAIGSGSYQEFIIKISDLVTGNPIDHARVCLNGGSLHQVKYTNPAGEVIFNVLPATNHVKLTITKHNYIPFQNDITVSSLGASLDILLLMDQQALLPLFLEPILVALKQSVFILETTLSLLPLQLMPQENSQFLLILFLVGL